MWRHLALFSTLSTRQRLQFWPHSKSNSPDTSEKTKTRKPKKNDVTVLVLSLVLALLQHQEWHSNGFQSGVGTIAAPGMTIFKRLSVNEFKQSDLKNTPFFIHHVVPRHHQNPGLINSKTIQKSPPFRFPLPCRLIIIQDKTNFFAALSTSKLGRPAFCMALELQFIQCFNGTIRKWEFWKAAPFGLSFRSGSWPFARFWIFFQVCNTCWCATTAPEILRATSSRVLWRARAFMKVIHLVWQKNLWLTTITGIRQFRFRSRRLRQLMRSWPCFLVHPNPDIHRGRGPVRKLKVSWCHSTGQCCHSFFRLKLWRIFECQSKTCSWCNPVVSFPVNVVLDQLQQVCCSRFKMPWGQSNHSSCFVELFHLPVCEFRAGHCTGRPLLHRSKHSIASKHHGCLAPLSQLNPHIGGTQSRHHLDVGDLGLSLAACSLEQEWVNL